ncbi:hypothetical protein, partial [Escherichia coli]|uniref:hypothetical protein n=1 Tax=Escherichia coli TaxID=562 RepID=UPI001AEBE7C6
DVLLGQDQRDAEFLVEPPQRLADLGDDVGLDALGRLVDEQDARVGGERPRYSELLLLAAREQARLPVQVLREVGEQG